MLIGELLSGRQKPMSAKLAATHRRRVCRAAWVELNPTAPRGRGAISMNTVEPDHSRMPVQMQRCRAPPLGFRTKKRGSSGIK